MIYLILIVFFIHFVVLQEWTNLYNKWCVITNYWKIVLKPFGFCLECTCGQVAFWYLIFTEPILEALGTTSGIIILIKLISYAKNRVEK